MRAERVYKLNKEKLERAIRAILDELYAKFPEVVEKWISERNEYIKVIITDPNERWRKFQTILSKDCYRAVVDFLRNIEVRTKMLEKEEKAELEVTKLKLKPGEIKRLNRNTIVEKTVDGRIIVMKENEVERKHV